VLELASVTGSAVVGSQAQTTEAGSKNHLICPSDVREILTFDESPRRPINSPRRP
jgi:hypothetical protein